MSEQLERYLLAYLGTMKGKSGPLYQTQTGERISKKWISDLVKRVAALAGISTHAHVLRHSFATAWVDNGGDVFHLCDVLGHADLRMTERYWHVNTKSRRNAFARAAPQL